MSALRQLTSDAAGWLYDAIIRAKAGDELDNVAKLMWQGNGEGTISDADAMFLSSCIERKRPGRGASRCPGTSTVEVPAQDGHLGVPRRISRFKPRQRSKASRDRRRRLGGSSALPDPLRSHYTEGQRAVLCIIAGEIKHHGICDLPVDKMGALAGVCRTTVQTTLHEARRLAHVKITERPRPGLKNLTNLIDIISPEWRTWLARGPSAHRPIGSNSLKMVSTTKNLPDDVVVGGEARSKNIHPPSALATQLAIEVARIEGHDPDRLPASWSNRNPELVVQGWIDGLLPVGLIPEQIPSFAKQVMARKPDRDLPRSIRYFSPTIIEVIEGCRSALAQLPQSQRGPFVKASGDWLRDQQANSRGRKWKAMA